MLQQEKKKKEEKWNIPKLKVVIACIKCNYREQLEYTKGIFVGQECIKLCKCGGKIVVDRIYFDEKSPESKKWEQYEELFR